MKTYIISFIITMIFTVFFFNYLKLKNNTIITSEKIFKEDYTKDKLFLGYKETEALIINGLTYNIYQHLQCKKLKDHCNLVTALIYYADKNDPTSVDVEESKSYYGTKKQCLEMKEFHVKTIINSVLEIYPTAKFVNKE